MKSIDIEYIFPLQVVVIIFLLGLLAVGIYGALQVESGLDLTDVVPRKSVEYKFVEARLKYFPFYPVALVTQDFDYANQQRKLLSYHEELKNVSAEISCGSPWDFHRSAVNMQLRLVHTATRRFYSENVSIVRGSNLIAQQSPCTRLAPGKFELTNRDSGGVANSTVLTSS